MKINFNLNPKPHVAIAAQAVDATIMAACVLYVVWFFANLFVEYAQ
jgi:hypothetical protein